MSLLTPTVKIGETMWAQNTKYICLPCQQLTSAGISCHLAKPNFDPTDKTNTQPKNLNQLT